MKNNKILKKILLIIINIIILSPQIVMAAPSLDYPISLRPGEVMTHEFYFFAEAASEKNADNKFYASVNIALFSFTGHENDEIKDRQICIALKTNGTNIYQTMYGKVKIENTDNINDINSFWDISYNNTPDDPVIKNCYDVWTMNKFYYYYYKIGTDGVEETIDITEAKTPPYYYAHNDSGANANVKKVCTKKITDTVGLPRNDVYHRHYSNVRYDETNNTRLAEIWTGWNNIINTMNNNTGKFLFQSSKALTADGVAECTEDTNKFTTADINNMVIKNKSNKANITDLKIMTPSNSGNSIGYFVIGRHLDRDGFILNYGDGVSGTFNGGQLPAIYGYEFIPICNAVQHEKTLTCEKPQAILEEGYLSEDDATKGCDYYFKSEHNEALIQFNQKGVLKTNLLGTYIKSGQSFEFKITYEDTISMKLINGNLDIDIKKDIQKFVSESELLKEKLAGSKPTFKNDKDVEEELPGEWNFSYTKDGINWVDINSDLRPMLEDFTDSHNGYTVTIKAEFELSNSYAQYNSVSMEKGVKHVYGNSPAEPDYIEDGRRYYTSLSIGTGLYPVKVKLEGLSAFNYKTEDPTKPIWSANYECGINCRQEFYDQSSNNFKFSTREVNSFNPFPIITGKESELDWRKKYIGLDANWVAYANAIGTDVNDGIDNIKDRIRNTSVPVPGEDPEYVIELEKKENIKQLKNNNANNEYFTLFGYKDDKKTSKYLEEIQETPVLAKVTKNNVVGNKIHEIGTCGDTRDLDGTCFCTMATEDGKCIYNREE